MSPITGAIAMKIKNRPRPHVCTTCLTREAVAWGLMVGRYHDDLRPDVSVLVSAAQHTADVLARFQRSRDHDIADANARAAADAVAGLLREVAAMTDRYEVRPTCQCDERPA